MVWGKWGVSLGSDLSLVKAMTLLWRDALVLEKSLQIFASLQIGKSIRIGKSSKKSMGKFARSQNQASHIIGRA